MAFKSTKIKNKVKKEPCIWCGWIAGSRHVAHIIDGKDWKTHKKVKDGEADWNALPLCPNCATIFDDVVRPKLYRALKEFGCKNLPGSWKQSNKIYQTVDKKI